MSKLFQSFVMCATFSMSMTLVSVDSAWAKPSEKRVIPEPYKVQENSGYVYLDQSITVSKLDPSNKVSYDLSKQLKTVWGVSKLQFQPTSPTKAELLLEYDQSVQGLDAYILEIDSILKIKASTEVGFYRGLTTLKQLMAPSLKVSPKKMKIRKQKIQDQAKHDWRGVMIDVSRNFFPISYLYQTVDRMAYYKLNRLHLHLSDDQGWRIEIKKYPNLTLHGGKSQVGGTKGGFYTQEEYKALVEYASQRHIIIVPEVDMPGHVHAALASVPEINCKGFTNIVPNNAEKNPPLPPKLYTGTAVGFSKLCLTKQESYDFATNVIKELAAMTPGPWIHIGGDEIEDENYIKFIHHADSVIHSLGKITIGWEEVLQANLHKETIAQIWRRIDRGQGSRLAIKSKAPVILSPCENFYLDHGNVHGQPNTHDWCTQDVTLKDVYTYQEQPQLNTIGFEAPVWTEYVVGSDEIDNRLWPRLLALSERTWSTQRNYTLFEQRVKSHYMDMSDMGIQFYRSK